MDTMFDSVHIPHTIAGAGNPNLRNGPAYHSYTGNQAIDHPAMYNSDEDHSDPNIFTVLAVHGPMPGTTVSDFLFFSPR